MQRIGGKTGKFGRIVRHIEHDRRIGIPRLIREANDRRGASPALKQRRHPYEPVLHDGGCLVFVPHAQGPVEQPRLPGANETGHIDRRHHIGERLVGLPVSPDSILCRKVLKTKRGLSVLSHRPRDAIRAQRIRSAEQVDEVPARIAVAPVPCIRIEQIPVEQEAGMLVVEPDRIVPHRAGAGPHKLPVNPVGEFRFGKAMLFEVRRREAMHQRGFGLRQSVRGGAAVAHDRLARDMQVPVGSHARELHRAIPPRLVAGRFVVVPEKFHFVRGEKAIYAIIA